ncbi:MAG: ATP synthase F1 subunit delta [Caldilineales bacterium]|nr:ATP synthase F1 subunit delta [Caldilineales bacterium]
MERTPEAYTRGILAAVLEPWIEGLNKVGSAYQTDRTLRAQLDDASVEPAAKLALLDGVMPAQAPAELRNFLGVLLIHNDFGFVDEILAALTRVFRAETAGPLRAVIHSAVPLSNEEKERIRNHLVAQFGANLEFLYQTDPDILGGLVVRVGDKLIDGSVRGRLDALRNSLGVRA